MEIDPKVLELLQKFQAKAARKSLSQSKPSIEDPKRPNENCPYYQLLTGRYKAKP